MTTAPSTQFPVVDMKTGRATPAWARFFAELTGSPGPIVQVTVTASPMAWTASESGTLVISGGTVTGVTLTRARMTVPLGAAARILMSKDDAVAITYTAAPTVYFIPS